MAELNDQQRVALLNVRLGLPEGSLDPQLALEALRHGSYAHERSLSAGRPVLRSNERLEFLGDAILGFLIARRVYERFREASEGELTRLRAGLVREESLAIVARGLGLGDLLLLGRGEQRSGGRENAARLADALEAVVAAVLLSCGLERTQEVVDRLLAPLFDQGLLARDPKTELQQLFQSRRRTPQYKVLSVAGPDHARSFEVEVRLDGFPLGRGSGRSKKEAEQAAARAALETPQALERALLDEAISLVPSDSAWPDLAAEESARLRAALVDADIEHIGSTAVPGLDGKAIIDLLIGVRELAPSLRIPDYEAFGEAGVPGRLYFRKRGPVSFNAQVVERGGPLWRDALVLRDYLRAHPEERGRYASGKREAIASGATTLLRYSDAKAALVEGLLERARRWAPG
ncbi:MAG: ribonuclease III [Deltaproteobacteria bacterium]|nr:MAG: ribonuclease III [Deltaproteobacteria bacterium]TMB37575.1 MAG: ribonuclease III [Deltaproteobacteria bacterium]